MNFYKILLVGIGGMLGSMSRFITVKAVDNRLSTLFPYGTLTVNFTGSLLLGFMMGISLKKGSSYEDWKLFLGSGFCGGFTTFSAFALENYNLMHKPGSALIYISVSIIAGIAGVAAGLALGKGWS